MASTHIIRRQFLDVEVAGTETDGHAVQRRLPDLCRDWLAPALEEVFQRAVPAHEHWTIDRLEIDAGSLRLENLERDLVEAVKQALERKFHERVPPADRDLREPGLLTGSSNPLERRTEAQSVHDAFFHFLETGVLPWWFYLPPGQTLEDVVRESWQTPGRLVAEEKRLANAFARALASTPARTRLVRQFSTGFLQALLARFAGDTAAAVAEIRRLLGTNGSSSPSLELFYEQVWVQAFTIAVAGQRSAMGGLVSRSILGISGAHELDLVLLERIAELWPEIAGHALLQRQMNRTSEDAETPSARATSGEAASRLDLQEGVFVSCAGLVLLHPFLPQLFGALGIVREDRMVDPGRALCLLHFLATGQRLAPEYELLLPKLLCGVPLDQPAAAPVTLTTAEEEEASALLAAAIRHWDALGDTSIDGLRGTFLLRPGKLSRRGDGEHVLQVETQSCDILLDRLPWGIGLVRLPWMQENLWVEWRF